MGKMLPMIFPDNNTSSGERKVFEYLRDYAPNDWVILHSYHIPKHNKVVFGEADFVVVAPNLGIIILEIKSGGVGLRSDGMWEFINRFGTVTEKPRGPFEQAYDAMFNIESIIKLKLGDNFKRTRILYTYGVIFTDTSDFDIEALSEYEHWRLLQNNNRYDYCTFIKKLVANQIKAVEELGKRAPRKMTQDECKEVVRVLRPTVDCVKPLKSFLEESEEAIIALTDEQYSCLDDIELNKHMVVLGGAGTGKTLIAIKDAENSASQGSKTLVLCFNRKLREHIKNNINSSNVHVYTLHGLMCKICGISDPQNMDSDFFSFELPLLACENLPDEKYLYDKIIIDEFQDICTNNYLPVIDKLLKAGLMDGKFSFYGDFSHQAIFDSDASLELLDDYAFYSKKMLSINCRNTKNIGNEMINISGFVEKRYKLTIDGEPVDYRVWNDEASQIEKIRTVIADLASKKIKSESIVILSNKVREKSIVNKIDPAGTIIGNYGDNNPGCFAWFSTAQSFKGLESKIVLLVDVDDYSDEKMMYVALSRARSQLIVFESKDAHKQRIELINKR